MRVIPRQDTFHFNGEFKLILQSIFSRDWKSGKDLLRLEQRFAKYIGCDYAILVPSVTFGMTHILKALLNKEDEVICPAFSHYSLPLSILEAGARPVFVDVDHDTLNIDVKQIEDNLTDKSRAIATLHFGGQVAEMRSILELAKKHKLFVISDCAHACGAEYKGRRLGSIEDASCFSFGTGKNIDGFGGGIVTTNSELVALRVKSAVESLCRWPNRIELILKVIRAYLQWLSMKPLVFNLFTLPLIWISTIFNKKGDILYEIANPGNKRISCGLSSKDHIRFSNLQAKIVLRHMDFLDGLNEQRRANAYLLRELLSDIRGVKPSHQTPGTDPVFLLYPVKTHDKWHMSFELLKRGIDTRKKYLGNICTELPLFKRFKADCPVSERLPQELLYLPVCPSLGRAEMEKIAGAIKRALK